MNVQRLLIIAQNMADAISSKHLFNLLIPFFGCITRSLLNNVVLFITAFFKKYAECYRRRYSVIHCDRFIYCLAFSLKFKRNDFYVQNFWHAKVL